MAMKEREYLNAILAIEGISEALTNETNARLAKLDEKNEKRKNTQTKAQKENEGVKTAILANLADGNGKAVASALGTALGISTQKASALCKLLVDEGKLTVAEIKVKGGGKVKEYTLVEVEEADEGADEEEADTDTASTEEPAED